MVTLSFQGLVFHLLHDKPKINVLNVKLLKLVKLQSCVVIPFFEGLSLVSFLSRPHTWSQTTLNFISENVIPKLPVHCLIYLLTSI